MIRVRHLVVQPFLCPICNRFSLITVAKIDAFSYKTMIFHYLFNEISLFILVLNN